LTALLSRAEDQHDEAALVAVLMMLAWGYAPQQIVTAILTNAPVNGLFQILDEDGDAVRPFLQNTNEPPARQRAAGDAPATTVASPLPTDDSEPTGSDDTFAAAAGVYRLQERSLRVAVESSVERYLSADGAIVIEPNGAVSGDYSFCDSETGVDTATGQAFESEVTSESSIDPATTPLFTETENGLRFEATMLVGLATENTLGQSYTNEGASFTVTGLVDVESGVLELTAPGSEFAIDFIR